MINQPKLPDIVGQLWFDGTFVEGPDAKLGVLSHSLHYGSAVFEGIRIYDGVPFMAEAHYDRMAASAKSIGYVLPFSASQLCDATWDLIHRNAFQDAYLRAIAWRGDEALGLLATGLTTHVAIAAWAWPKVHSSSGTGGVSLWPSASRRPAPETLPPQAKTSGSYLIGMLAYREAQQNDCNDALLCDADGNIAETSSANLFFVRNGTLCTPKATGFLNGLTRQTVLKLAQTLGLSIEQGEYAMSDLIEAQEVFICGTAVEIEPVVRIGTHRYSIGDITRKLARAYGDHVRSNNNVLFNAKRELNHIT